MQQQSGILNDLHCPHPSKTHIIDTVTQLYQLAHKLPLYAACSQPWVVCNILHHSPTLVAHCKCHAALL